MSAEIWTACQPVIVLCYQIILNSHSQSQSHRIKNTMHCTIKEMKLTDSQNCLKIITARRHSLKNR